MTDIFSCQKVRTDGQTQRGVAPYRRGPERCGPDVTAALASDAKIVRGHFRTLAQLTLDFPWPGGEQLPVPLGDDLDRAVDHFDGGVVVDRVRRPWDFGRPSFCAG